MNKALMAEYRRFRKAGLQASHAMSAAAVELQWDRLESAGFVKLTAEPDTDYDWADDAEREKFGADGAWGSCGWFTLDPDTAEDVEPRFRGTPWHGADSVWGHVGYRNVLDAAENWYVTDIKRGTIAALATALKARYCSKCGHRAAV